MSEAAPLTRSLLLLMVVMSFQVARPSWALTPAEGAPECMNLGSRPSLDSSISGCMSVPYLSTNHAGGPANRFNHPETC